MHSTEAFWKIAGARAPALAHDLARLELAFGNWGPISASREALEAAIHAAWCDVMALARDTRVSLEPSFIASLHERIARPIGAPGAGVFREGEPPTNWAEFKKAMDDTELEYGLARHTDAWVLAQLYGRGHLDSLMLSVAWLLSSGIRLQEGAEVILPDARHDAELKKSLEWAGPDAYDAESLRALYARYEAEETPDLSPP